MTDTNEFIVTQCSGGAGTGPALFNYWDTHDCVSAYQQKYYSATGGVFQYSLTQRLKVEANIDNLFKTYLKTNEITNDVTSPDYNKFQETLLTLCLNQSIPGACDLAMDNICTGYSIDFLAGNEALTNFCGCDFKLTNDAGVLDLTNFTCGTQGCMDGLSECKSCKCGTVGCAVLPQCNPLCHRTTTIQRAGPGGYLIRCPETICVINDVVINAENTKLRGGINFNTVCGACQGLGCLCVISGVNISETAASVGISSDFNQYCGPDSVCINNGTQINCSKISTDSIPVNTKGSLPSTTVLILSAILIGIIIILLLAAYFA